MKINIDLFKCPSDETIVGAMKIINNNSYGFTYVVDKSDRLVGCITDGDIRRWLISGGKLNSHVSKAMNTNPVYVTDNQRKEGTHLMTEKVISSVAVVDDSLCIIDIMLASPKKQHILNAVLSGTPVVIMAGGKGTRLYPYTKILPKPLIPIGEVPILERIIDRFIRFGAVEFYLTINYRKEMIKAYFAETPHSYTLHYVEEDTPLGTAGSMRFIGSRFEKPIFVTNCDILVEADYGEVLNNHIAAKNDMTIVVSLKNTIIPYGVVRTGENGVITSLVEKPEISNFINTGMYVINPEYIEWIPEGKPFHMTELAELLMSKGKRVGMYPVGERDFLDMGEFSEMKRMEESLDSEL